MHVVYTAESDVARALLRFEAGGPAVEPLIDTHTIALTGGVPFTLTYSVALAANGAATLDASLHAQSAGDRPPFTVADHLDLLLTETGSFSGRSGTLDLQLRALESLWQQGMLTDADYQARRDALLGSGAAETIVIETPAP